MPNNALYAAERSVASKTRLRADLEPHRIAIAVTTRFMRIVGYVIIKESLTNLADEEALWA